MPILNNYTIPLLGALVLYILIYNFNVELPPAIEPQQIQQQNTKATIPPSLKAQQTSQQCFCELKGSINDCNCDIESVDHFNNVKIYPRLKSLLVKNYFRFYKVNLRGECPFWRDNSRCDMRFCQVQDCDANKIPQGLKESAPAIYRTRELTGISGCSEAEDYNRALGSLDPSLSAQAHKEFALWAQHDALEEDFCILDDFQEGAQYVDLLLNPERYTGYRGMSAHRIWKSIYLENCFKESNNESNPLANLIPTLNLNGVCSEQRAFYRLISGLHASINIHLCAKYLLSESKDFLNPRGVWGANVDEFRRRFSPETTNNEGPNWLRNLYFIYLVELRALAKAAPYLRRENFYTGIMEEDNEVKMAINDLLSVIGSFPTHFDEGALFSKGVDSKQIKTMYKEKFRNITRIMDCVGCEKCRLWGKLQTQGLGTALKVLYSEKFNRATESGLWDKLHIDTENVFRLKRSEIVALFNAFGRLSNSIFEVEQFRKMLS